MGKQWKQCQTLFFGAPKLLQMVWGRKELDTTERLNWTEGQVQLFAIPWTIVHLPSSSVCRISQARGTGVGCHFLSLSRGSSLPRDRTHISPALVGKFFATVLPGYAVLCLVTQLFLTLCDPMDCSQPGSSVHGGSPGKNTGPRCCALLQGILPNQGLNPGLPLCRHVLYCLTHHGSLRCPIHFH